MGLRGLLDSKDIDRLALSNNWWLVSGCDNSGNRNDSRAKARPMNGQFRASQLMRQLIVATVSETGSTCLPNDLKWSSVAYGPVPDDLRAWAVNAALVRGELMSVQLRGERRTASTECVLTEMNIYRYLKTQRGEVSVDPSALREAVGDTLVATGCEPDPAQYRAIFAAIGRRVVIIGGKGGTGKTEMVLATLACYCRHVGTSVLFMAPTHGAIDQLRKALPAGAQVATLQSMVYNLSPKLGKWMKQSSNDPILVIEEASLMCADDFGSLVSMVRRCRHRLVLVGDDGQLPPVAWGQPLVDCVRSGVLTYQRLINVYRANTKELERFTDSARPPVERWGRIPRLIIPDCQAVTSHLTSNPEEDERAPFCIQMLEARLNELRQQDCTVDQVRVLTWTNESAVEYGKVVRRVFRGVDSDRAFETGDPVILTKNYSEHFFNGRRGVVATAPENIRARVIVRFQDVTTEQVAILKFRAPELSIDAPNGKTWIEFGIRPSNLSPATSTTVHRAQGSGFDHVIYVRSNWPSPTGNGRLNYTAYSRTKATLTLIGNQAFFIGERPSMPGDERDTLLEGLLTGQASINTTWGSHKALCRMRTRADDLERRWRGRQRDDCDACCRPTDREHCVAGPFGDLDNAIVCLDCHQL
jgi:hypothetical protein